MSCLVRLYVRELTREGGAMTIQDVPAQLRPQVEAAMAELEAGHEQVH